jgi:hypothetical protein
VTARSSLSFMAVIPWAVILSRGGQCNPHRSEIRISERISHDRDGSNRQKPVTFCFAGARERKKMSWSCRGLEAGQACAYFGREIAASGLTLSSVASRSRAI